MEELQRVREMFEKDRFATENGAVIDEIGDHYAKCSLTITDRHRNALGGVMGGVYFTLADFAFAVASNWQKPGTVAISSDIAFVGACKGTSLTAETSLVKNGRTTCCYRVDVTDNLGNAIAAVTFIGFHKQ